VAFGRNPKKLEASFAERSRARLRHGRSASVSRFGAGGLARAQRPLHKNPVRVAYLHVPWYFDTLIHMNDDPRLEIQRVQTGVRMEKRILKVLKAFAEYHDMTLGDVLEGIVLHAFDGKTPFSPASLEKIRDLKKFYDLDLDSSASHRLKEIKAKSGRQRRQGA
jgi:hypothetical protein